MKVVEVAQRYNTDQTTVSTASDMVGALKKRTYPETPLKDILKEIDINLHDVMDPTLRPNKPVYKKKGVVTGTKKAYAGSTAVSADEPEFSHIEYVNRINLSFQLMICNKRVSFCLANPVKRIYKGLKKGESDLELNALKYALERILYDNKVATQDREVGRNIFTYTEVAEYIYQSDIDKNGTKSDKYGFETGKKIKISTFTRENGEKFYPIKDDFGDLICFSREYKKRESGRLVTYFTSYTDEEIVTFKQNGASNWVILGEPKPHDLGKMPIVFGWQRYPEYYTVTRLIARLEQILSNHAEVNDYHASPKLLLTNADLITGFGEKGSSSMVIQAKGEAKMEYVTWEHSTDSVKAEIDRLLEMIYMLTQTPNISFDNLKGMGAVSGVSIKLMFMDAHLAVKDKEGVLLDFFQRRNSIICAYLSKLNPKFQKIVDKVEINSELDPFMISDDKEKAEIAQIENAGQATKSQLTTVIEAGGDQEEYDQIQKEESARKIVDITEPTE